MKLVRIIRQNLWWRGPVHRLIAWYLRYCGGAFHVYPYGENGRYVVLLTEYRYSSLQQDKALDRLLEDSPRQPTEGSK